jgi:hypothetical protein
MVHAKLAGKRQFQRAFAGAVAAALYGRRLTEM